MNTVCFLCGSLFNPNLQRRRYRSGVIKVQSGKGAEPRPLLLGSLSRAFFFFFGSVSFFPLHVGLHVSEAGKEDLLKYQVGGRKS